MTKQHVRILVLDLENNFLTILSGNSYTDEGLASFEKLESLFGDQREDSLTSLEVCYLL